ncbi:putative RNA-directed DNA polymerase, eukaryota, reverse transcriptase zinc-binding domain protein [Tanacetum coccineum]|uniref:RNA-directed DNA polymerase, eukaryota, reverse transcriptase zinc-binding domain protein n=1 Tax=Tanacetum coccineum TaxID=301880 RepID=A0ABQ5G724_9ASTR
MHVQLCRVYRESTSTLSSVEKLSEWRSSRGRASSRQWSDTRQHTPIKCASKRVPSGCSSTLGWTEPKPMPRVRIGFAIARGVEAQIDIVAIDVTNAVREFFINGKLLKEVTHTIIALIPKVASPYRINDYRLISCCNVMFKCISKIISNRIKESLTYLVSPNQSAFCKDSLMGFGFHHRMIHWIMECVSFTSFSLSINGTLHGYFMGQRGLRQGDPMSPYLFTLIMDCRELTEKVHNRLKDWKNKSLSAAGRLQLVQSVIGRSLVKEDGYVQQGAYDLSYLRASFSKGIFVGEMDSCLQAKGMKFLGCPYSGKHDVGMEKDSPTLSYYSENLFGIELETWPLEWFLKYPVLSTIVVLTIDPNFLDVLEWRNHLGMALSFSISMVWDCIRPKGDEINSMLYGSPIAFLIMHFIYGWLSNGS